MKDGKLKVLVIGGYGNFGGRIVELLQDDQRLTLVIAGRSRDRAARFGAGLSHARADIIPAAFDRNADLTAQLALIAPHIVVDASGPFQAYGDNPYKLVRECIQQGIHYMDLADGSDFVSGIGAFDDEARERGIFVLSGVSTFPVLSSAVLNELRSVMPVIHDVTMGIAPSPFADIGLNVIRAIASYTGRRVTLMRDGKWTSGYGLTEATRFTIAPPGVLPLHSRRFSLVDVPDLRLVPENMPGIRTVWTGAGTVPEILHRMLNTLGWFVRFRLAPPVTILAPLFHRVMKMLRWGEHRGGMFICARGSDDAGTPVERSWHMIAEADDGPYIPAMAVEGVVGKVLEGAAPDAGARPASGALTLPDYERLFSSKAIHWGWRQCDTEEAGRPLFRRVLGDAWECLPEPVKAMHDNLAPRMVTGEARVERGGNPLARLVASMVGFPREAEHVPLTVSFDVVAGKEIWRRNFGGRVFHSSQNIGRGGSQWLLCEKFGLLAFGLALVVSEGRLEFIVRNWRLAGLPLPLWLAPQSRACETAENGRFRFDVEIAHPLIGRIVRYSGWLEPEGSQERR